MKFRSLVLLLPLLMSARMGAAAEPQVRLDLRLFVFDRPQLDAVQVGNDLGGEGTLSVVAGKELKFGHASLSLAEDYRWSTGKTPDGVTAADVPALVARLGQEAGFTWTMPTQYFEPENNGTYALRDTAANPATSPHWKISFLVRSADGTDPYAVSAHVEWTAVARREKLPGVDLDVGKPIVATADRRLDFRIGVGTWSALLVSPPNNGDYGALILVRVTSATSATKPVRHPMRKLYVQAITQDKAAFDHWRHITGYDLFYDSLAAEWVKAKAKAEGFESLEVLPFGTPAPTDAPVLRLDVKVTTEAGGYYETGGGGAFGNSLGGSSGASTPPPPPQPHFTATYVATATSRPIAISPTDTSPVLSERELRRLREPEIAPNSLPVQAYFVRALRALRQYLDSDDIAAFHRMYVQVVPLLDWRFDKWRHLSDGRDVLYDALRIAPELARREGFQDVVVLPQSVEPPGDAPILRFDGPGGWVSYLPDAKAKPIDLGPSRLLGDPDDVIRHAPLNDREIAAMEYAIQGRFVSGLRKVRKYLESQPQH